MRKALLILALLLPAPARAQITIPNTFTNGTVADANDVNANFTALGNQALNRTGGTMTGDLLFNDALFDIGKIAATRPRDGFFSRNLTVGGVITAGSVIGAGGGTLVLTGPVSSGNLTVGGTLGVTGATTLATTLSAGATTLSSLGVVGTSTFTGVVTAGTINLGTLSVSGTSTLTGGVSIAGTVSAGTINAGATTVSSLGVTGGAAIAGTTRVGFLQLAGTTASFPAWRNTGPVAEAVLADQTQYASVRALNYISMAGGTQLADLTVTGGTNLSGSVSVGGNLAVTGTVAATGGVRTVNVVIVTTAYSAAAYDFVLASGTFNVTLPAPTINTIVDVKNWSGSGTITVVPSTGLIDSAGSYPLSLQNQSVTVVADGANWWIR